MNKTRTEPERRAPTKPPRITDGFGLHKPFSASLRLSPTSPLRHRPGRHAAAQPPLRKAPPYVPFTGQENQFLHAVARVPKTRSRRISGCGRRGMNSDARASILWEKRGVNLCFNLARIPDIYQEFSAQRGGILVRLKYVNKAPAGALTPRRPDPQGASCERHQDTPRANQLHPHKGSPGRPRGGRRDHHGPRQRHRGRSQGDAPSPRRRVQPVRGGEEDSEVRPPPPRAHVEAGRYRDDGGGVTAPTHELRDCYRCHRGQVYRPPTTQTMRGFWVPCPECGGKGTRLTFIYVMDHARRWGRRGL